MRRLEHLLPTIQLIDPKWLVQVVVDEQGNSVAQSPLDVPLDETGLDKPGFTAMVEDLDDQTVLNVEIKTITEEATIDVGGGVIYVTAGNLTRLIVIAEGETELGEMLRAETEELFRPPCQIGKTIAQIFADLQKFIVIGEFLREEGILPDDPWPEEEILNEWPSLYSGEAEGHRILESLPTEWQPLFTNFVSWANGYPVDPDQLQELFSLTQRAAIYPDFEPQPATTMVSAERLRALTLAASVPTLGSSSLLPSQAMPVDGLPAAMWTFLAVAFVGALIGAATVLLWRNLGGQHLPDDESR